MYLQLRSRAGDKSLDWGVISIQVVAEPTKVVASHDGKREPRALDEIWNSSTCKELAEKEELSKKIMRHSGERSEENQRAVS